MAVRAPGAPGAGATALTWDDLQEMPDDGYRRELVHGQLLMTPSPAGRHQVCVVELVVLLRSAATPGRRVLVAPYDWKLAPDTVFVPDLLVVDEREFDPGGPFVGTPLLVVEVLSPSTRSIDQTLKRREYEQAGAPAYWLVDPTEPSLTVLHLTDGTYHEVAEVRGEDAYQADFPFPVTIVPARLTD